MNLKECVKGSIQQLLSNKLRTFLTMLGMFIGIGAVIMVLSIGAGVKDKMSGLFSDIGKGSLQINVSNYDSEYMMTQDDLEVIRQIPEIKEVVAFDNGYGTKLRTYKDEDKTMYIGGIPYNFGDVQHIEIVAGRNISKAEDTMKANVLLVSDTFAKIIHGKSNPNDALGETVELTIGGVTSSFEIIGLMKTETFPGMPEDSMPLTAYIPFSTLDQIVGIGDQRTYSAVAVVKDEYNPNEIGYQVQRLLDKRHSTKNGYKVESAMKMIEQIDSTMTMVTSFIGLVAAISLVVGGIGIMNIMLVTVKERTREIGIRKAIGATNKEILRQFLIEAMILTLLGGVVGMLLGYFGGAIVGAVVKLNVKLTASMIIFSVGTSSAIGILFGVYPAYQASKLDPVEALRYE
ncbi:MAG: ABC transporter permease [Cellulosilyticaceae bacterium]